MSPSISSSLVVWLGFVAVSRFDSVNEYFLSAAVWGAVLFSPVLGFVGLFDTAAFYLLPVQALLVTVEAGLHHVPSWEVVYAFAYLVAGNAVAFRWARRSFDREVVREGDPGRRLGYGSRGGAGRRRRVDASRSPWLGLLLTDGRNWVRDPMLAFATVGPLALATLVRVVTPTVTARLADVVDLTAYYPVVAGTMAVFGPGIFGFVVGMLVLEDRDTDVLTAYRTSPLSLRGYLAYRGSTAFLFAALSTLPSLLVVGLVGPSVPVLLETSVLAGLSGAVVGLVLGTVASDSIEGVALSKFLNLLLLGPALTVALVPEPAQLLAGVVPAYWPVKVYVAGVTDDPRTLALFVVGVGVHLLALAGVVRVLVPRLSGR